MLTCLLCCSGDSADSPVPFVTKPQHTSPLTISGFQLTALPLKKMSLFSNKTEIQRSAAALGYVAHVIFGPF